MSNSLMDDSGFDAIEASSSSSQEEEQRRYFATELKVNAA